MILILNQSDLALFLVIYLSFGYIEFILTTMSTVNLPTIQQSIINGSPARQSFDQSIVNQFPKDRLSEELRPSGCSPLFALQNRYTDTAAFGGAQLSNENQANINGIIQKNRIYFNPPPPHQAIMSRPQQIGIQPVVSHQVQAASFQTNLVQNTQATIERVVIPPAPRPAPTRRVQYIPHDTTTLQYHERTIQVPCEKFYTDYYEIQHVVDYVPIQKQDIVYVTQPQEVISMKLQYVPVEKKIVHLPGNTVQNNHFNQYNSVASQQYQTRVIPPGQATYNMPQSIQPGYSVDLASGNQLSTSFNQASINAAGTGTRRRHKSNFVTSNDYDPERNYRQMERILSQSALNMEQIRTQNTVTVQQTTTTTKQVRQ